MERSELVAQPPNVTEFPFKESHMKLATVSTQSTNDFDSAMEIRQRSLSSLFLYTNFHLIDILYTFTPIFKLRPNKTSVLQLLKSFFSVFNSIYYHSRNPRAARTSSSTTWTRRWLTATKRNVDTTTTKVENRDRSDHHLNQLAHAGSVSRIFRNSLDLLTTQFVGF